MPKSKFDWSTELAALPSDEFRSSVPLAAFLKEANTIAAFFRAHYKADKKTGLPGLNEAGPAVNASLADEIESLVDEGYKASSDYRLTVDPKADRSKLDRAAELVDEIHAVLEFHLDDGVEDEHDARLANVVNAHKDAPESGAAFALSLEEYAELAAMYETEIDGLGGFDVKLIAEAKKLSKELRGATEPAAPSAAQQGMLAKRNRILQLIDARVRRVRAATKFVFRKHPEMVRSTASAYERTRRVIAKRVATRKKNNANNKPAEPVTPNA